VGDGEEFLADGVGDVEVSFFFQFGDDPGKGGFEEATAREVQDGPYGHEGFSNVFVVDGCPFPLDCDVRIGDDTDAWAIGGTEDDGSSGVSEKKGSVGAVVTGEGTEFVQDSGLFLSGGFLIPPGELEGDLLAGHQIQLLVRHGTLPPCMGSCSGERVQGISCRFFREATLPSRVDFL
jgi:hypothetical protein